MTGKLTLSIEESLIKKAKVWAGSHDVSLSGVISEFLMTLTDSRELEVSPWTAAMIGIAEVGGQEKTDGEIKDGYTRYLEEKY